MNNYKKKNVMISLDTELLEFVKNEGLCLSKEVQKLIRYLKDNKIN